MLTEFIKKLTQPVTSAQKAAPEPLDVALASAVLFMEVAWADHDFSDGERRAMRQLLQKQLGLNLNEVDTLLAEAQALHDSSVGMQSFTRAITDGWEEPQRYQLMVALWQLAMADDTVHHYEEHALRRIADLIYLSHTRFIEAKLTAKRA